jgi:AcrR family transcriptional regulator
VKQPPPDLAERLWQVSDRFLAPGTDLKIDELAGLAGVPRATIYYYFSGKDDVMAFLLAQKVERAGVVVAEAAAGPGSASDRLGRVLRALLEQMAEHPALCTRLLCWMTATTAEHLLVEAQASLWGPLRELVVEGQATGEFAEIDPVDATTAITGALSMVAMHHTVNGDFDPHAVADRLISWLFDGLRSRRPTAARGSGAGGRRRARGPVAG